MAANRKTTRLRLTEALLQSRIREVTLEVKLQAAVLRGLRKNLAEVQEALAAAETADEEKGV